MRSTSQLHIHWKTKHILLTFVHLKSTTGPWKGVIGVLSCWTLKIQNWIRYTKETSMEISYSRRGTRATKNGSRSKKRKAKSTRAISKPRDHHPPGTWCIREENILRLYITCINCTLTVLYLFSIQPTQKSKLPDFLDHLSFPGVHT